MAKIKNHPENFRVVVEPKGLGDFGWMSIGDSYVTKDDPKLSERLYRERCEEIINSIRRHVDDVRDAYIEYDTEDVCEHCGWPWTETSDTYNGGCCEKDEEGKP